MSPDPTPAADPVPERGAPVVVHPALLSEQVHAYLERSAASLAEAAHEPSVPARYATAHVAALQAAAAVVAARSRPQAGRHRGRSTAWTLLARLAPELEEWAAFFAAGAAKRAAAAAGSARAVSAREADDLLRDAERFLSVVEQTLGLAPRQHGLERLRAG